MQRQSLLEGLLIISADYNQHQWSTFLITAILLYNVITSLAIGPREQNKTTRC